MVQEQEQDERIKEIEMLKAGSIYAWIDFEHLKTETGKELDFHTHRYLEDIYGDPSPCICCVKAGQIGFSTFAIFKTMHLVKNKHLDVGYILPTVEMVQKFVGSKVNRISQQNPTIQAAMKDKDSITQKQIGENYIFYLGAQTDRSAIMLSLDMLVADEYDKAPQDILEIYDSRLQHSQYGYKYVFSNPTIPDFGVDRFWQISDKKMWHVKHSCGETFILDESCIDYKQEIYKCPKCFKEIIDEERRTGEWVKTAQGKWSGYWIPLWLNPMISASVICEKKRTNTAEYFANFVVGLPFINTNNQLSQGMLEKCLLNQVNTQDGKIVIGIDTGRDIWYTITNKDGFFYHGHCQSVEENKNSDTPIKNYDPYDEIDALMKRFPKAIIVADQGGDLIGIQKLQQRYIGRVYLCLFTKETRNLQLTRWGENDEDGKVSADRNRCIQQLVDEIKENRITFYGTKEDWQPVFNHSLNIYRVKEIIGEENDPQYGWRWVWHRKGADHLFLSMVYARIGLDRFGEEAAVIISKKGFMSGIPTARIFNINKDYEVDGGISPIIRAEELN